MEGDTEMLNDAVGYDKIYIALGYTDLRRGIDGLAATISTEFNLSPFQKKVLFLFCGRSGSKIKGLIWEGDGFLLLNKRLENGRFQWPRNTQELKLLTPEQFVWLMKGLKIEPGIQRISPKQIF